MCLHHSFEPSISPTDVVQATGFIVASEDLSVLSQLSIDIPVHEASFGGISKSVHDKAGFNKHTPSQADFPLGECHLKVLADLLQKLALQLSHTPAQRRDLFDTAIAIEVFHEL